MSGVICLKQDGEIVKVPPFIGGITHEMRYKVSTTGELFLSRERVVIVPSEEARVIVTWNYSSFFDFKQLDERKAKDTCQVLHDVVEKLGTKGDEDPYAPTPGNVGWICSLFLSWAEDHPDATWEVV